MIVTRVDRIQLTYELTFQTPFHCGTGLSMGLIDRTIVRDRDGYLYVPGSTIKGVLREYCEQLERLYEEFDLDLKALIASPHGNKENLWEFGQSATMITRIFGSHTHPGLLFFDDARQLEQDKQRSLQTDLYTQVRLDRLTRTAVPGALYTSEFGVKKLSFVGKITGWLECAAIESIKNGPTYSLLLLLAGLHMIDRIGGNKSTGKGQCQITITELTINKVKNEQWSSWLDHLEMLSYYSMDGASQEDEA